MGNLVIGILAHVDAGKTTLSESMLYLSGKIRKPGRVDNGDAYLDTDALEKERGITIFSKQAVFEAEGARITLLDTPGHADFSAEMERTLQVLDYAVLVVSGADGVQGHTRTVWRLLDAYRIPVFLFINKMDQNGTNREKILRELKTQLSDGCVAFDGPLSEGFYDELALCGESLLGAYLDTGRIETARIREAVRGRQVFPCFFGSALKLQGVGQLLQGLARYAAAPAYPEEFGARVFKITRDGQGNRLTHLKVTGGALRVKDVLTNGEWKEKVNQIRVYSGQKFEAVSEAPAGSVCAVTGLTQTGPGEGLGAEQAVFRPVLAPVLSYRVGLPEGCDPRAVLPLLRRLEEEEPELRIAWDERAQEIHAQLMGEVQLEILQRLIRSRFGVEVSFGAGTIVYKETIAQTVEGVGHFEPLRHYAEVHLLLEPGARGSGLRFGSACSEDMLGKSWQRLILTHLREKEHRGVLTGSAITDMKITLVSGRAHAKHTEGGDFREATYRAVRQGLREAESVLLEPYYAFELELPEKMLGKAMNDIELMHGACEISRTDGDAAVLTGSAPVATLRNYQKEVAAYTRGLGRLSCTLEGYRPCHNAEEVVGAIGYDPERDLENPTGSVFCAHGAGFPVEWREVKRAMHLPAFLQPEEEPAGREAPARAAPERQISIEEIDRLLRSASFANQNKNPGGRSRRAARQSGGESAPYVGAPREIREDYLLVDGYNVIYAWPELASIAGASMDGARTKLLDLMSSYQALRKCRVIVVFDAYRVQGHREEALDYHNIHVVYTREAQTADQYIERFAHSNSEKYAIRVATSDGLQQIIVRGAGCALLSSRELKAELEREILQVTQQLNETRGDDRSRLKDALPDDVVRRMREPDGRGR